MREEYITRLIAGIREEVEKHMLDTFDGPAIPATWIDAVLLCDVIEEDIARRTRCRGRMKTNKESTILPCITMMDLIRPRRLDLDAVICETKAEYKKNHGEPFTTRYCSENNVITMTLYQDGS